MWQTWVRPALFCAVAAAGLVSTRTAYAETLLVDDFSSGDAGFTVVNTGAVENPWAYSAGFWATGGSENLGSPTASALVSPTLTATVGGEVTLSFSHRHSFELDSTVWDGGQVLLSVNGGAFATVPSASFSANGYGGVVGGNNALNGKSAFIGNSPGYAAGEVITSVASLGTFSVGDTIAVEFLGAWDEFARGTNPNWVIDSVSVTSVPEPSALALGLIALVGLAGRQRLRRR